MFKKGDKVKCVDNYNVYDELTESKIYDVEELRSFCLIRVKNDRGVVSNYSETRFELVKEEKQMKKYQFKLGQEYKVISTKTDAFTEGKIYEVVKRGVVLALQSDYGSFYLDSEIPVFGIQLELVSDSKEEPFTPTIEIDFLIDYINNNQLESDEILSFLKGHKKGQVFIHETLK